MAPKCDVRAHADVGMAPKCDVHAHADVGMAPKGMAPKGMAPQGMARKSGAVCRTHPAVVEGSKSRYIWRFVTAFAAKGFSLGRR
jgi:hypothetical protein